MLSLVHNHIVFVIITRHAHRPDVIENLVLTEYDDMMKKSTDVTTGQLLVTVLFRMILAI